MAQDWAENVLKYVPNADSSAIAGIVRHCGIALHTRDASLVSFNDPTETDRVRESFLKKKLGLTLPDAELDQAIASVGETMKAEHFRNRVTVYYLLAQKFNLLHLFHKDAHGEVGAAGTAALGAAGAAASAVSGAAGTAAHAVGSAAHSLGHAVGSAGEKAGALGSAAMSSVGGAAASGLAGAQRLAHEVPSGGKKGLWIVLAVIVLAVVLWLLRSCSPTPTASTADVPVAAAPDTTAPVAAPAVPETAASAPAAAPEAVADTAAPSSAVEIPQGSGVIVGTRDGKPLVTVYFATSSAEVAPDFDKAAAGLKDYLDAHGGSGLTLSGFADKTGNAAFNAKLAKSRAEAVKAGLIKAGISEGSVELTKPKEAIDSGNDLAGSRRVEVSIK